MVRKPGRMYRKITGPAYTKRAYMGGVPASRIQQFVAGNVNGNYDIELRLVAEESCQIRHTALEAARISSNRQLMKDFGENGYFMRVRPFPHHVIREHKMATGAGADRISSGMSMSFGRPVGTAARVKRGSTILIVRIPKTGEYKAKEALRKASHKIPTPSRVDTISLTSQS
ncbi:MAG: 50S ribosomal protein L16 [Candidatus Thermoplasmatota archaeon]|jgi:large subunit ribosomal protein L10e|nr:50S ribosomal protein L16 [Candidatus Thermoplasmatota archaeon]